MRRSVVGPKTCVERPQYRERLDGPLATCFDRWWSTRNGEETLVTQRSRLSICQSESKRAASNSGNPSKSLLKEALSVLKRVCVSLRLHAE